jgi:multiple sugar transport system substrate-binding protein
MAPVNRRVFLTRMGSVVATTVVGAVLTACRSSPSVPTTVTARSASTNGLTAVSNPTTTTVVTPQAAMRTATKEAVTLALWLIQLSPEQDKPFRTQVISPFAQNYPGLSFDLQYMTWSNVQEKVLTAMAGGVGPDIFQSAPQWTPLFIGKPGKENLLALDGYLATWDGAKDFYDNVMSSCKMRGKTWGLPYGADTRAILYRKDIFTDAGLDPETPPKNWHDLAEMATRTTKRNGDQWERAGYNVAPNFPNEFARGQQWVNFFYQQGGEYFNEDFSKVLWNTEPGVKALQFMIDLIYVNKVCPLGGLRGGATPAEDAFLTGKLAIQDGSVGALYAFKQYAPDKLKLVGFGYPLREVKQVMFLGGNSLHIWSGTKHKDESWTGMSYLLSPSAIAIYGEITNTPTTRISVNETAAYMKADPLLQDFARAGQYGKTVPSVPGGQQLSKFLSDAIDAATRKLVTAKQALDDAAQKANSALAQAAKSNQ